MGCIGRLVGDSVDGAGGDVGRVEAVFSRHWLDLTWFSEGDVDALWLLISKSNKGKRIYNLFFFRVGLTLYKTAP